MLLPILINAYNQNVYSFKIKEKEVGLKKHCYEFQKKRS